MPKQVGSWQPAVPFLTFTFLGLGAGLGAGAALLMVIPCLILSCSVTKSCLDCLSCQLCCCSIYKFYMLIRPCRCWWGSWWLGGGVTNTELVSPLQHRCAATTLYTAALHTVVVPSVSGDAGRMLSHALHSILCGTFNGLEIKSSFSITFSIHYCYINYYLRMHFDFSRLSFIILKQFITSLP